MTILYREANVAIDKRTGAQIDYVEADVPPDQAPPEWTESKPHFPDAWCYWVPA